LSEYSIQSSSPYLARMIISSANGVISTYDVLLHSVEESAEKTIGIRLDNRTSSIFKDQSEMFQMQTTSVEDVYNIGMGTANRRSTICIRAAELANNRLCVSDETGILLHQAIVDALHNGKRVLVSFKNITEISSAFFESAFGRLYLIGFTEEEIKRRVIISDLSEDDRFILDMVIDRVRDFLKDPVRFETIMNEVLGEDNDPSS
jgi:hypothetical protein